MKNLPIFSFIGVCVGVVILIVYGVLTHKEAGFTPGGKTRWEKSDFPLSIAIVKQDDELGKMNAKALMGAVDALNSRLGFEAFAYPDVLPCKADVEVNFQVPYEKDRMETSGLATCKKGRCQVDICNTATLAATSLAVRHELGHVLGLDHDDFEDSLMYGGELNAGQQYRLTDYDRSIIRARYAP